MLREDWMRSCACGLALAAVGCFGGPSDGDGGGGSTSSGGSGGTTNPLGPVAENKEQAWPNKPDVPAITREQIAEACVLETTCALGADPGANAPLAVELCIGQLVWSAERAIPLSNLWHYQERAEHFVACVLAAAGDCEAQTACRTGRDSSIHCEEDGCRNLHGSGVSVSCDGPIATLSKPSGESTRDCSLAFAECDPASPTGCTDRQFSACPSGVSQADRCDGNVRLGCDGAGQVSYHDCERMGGTCGTTSGGSQDCIYQPVADAECAETTAPSAICSGSELSVCVLAKRISLNAPGICAQSG